MEDYYKEFLHISENKTNCRFIYKKRLRNPEGGGGQNCVIKCFSEIYIYLSIYILFRKNETFPMFLFKNLPNK